MAYADKGDRMANSYSISCRTFKWTKKLFFHLLDLAILNGYILHSSCGGKKMSHRDFRYTLVRNMLAHAGPEWRVPRPLGRPPNIESHVARLEVCSSKHGLSHLRRGWGVGCVRPGVWHGKCSWSAVNVKWDCALKKHILKITTQRHNSNNITCDLLKKNWGIKPICKYKKLKFLHIP